MLAPFLAETATTAGTSWVALTAVGAALAIAMNLVLFIRLAAGKQNERQIEPTQLAAMQAEMRANHNAVQNELRSQTTAISKIDREVGEISSKVETVRNDTALVRSDMQRLEDNAFKRINAISAESTETRARVDGIERREVDRRK